MWPYDRRLLGIQLRDVLRLELADNDIVRTFGSVHVVVDPESAELIKGATLEYRDGLQEAGFHIINPNATRTCGCGSSFS